MCEVLKDIFVGLFSGIVSSTIVTLIFLHIDRKRQHEKGFKDDKQTYHRWILRVRNELELSKRIGDYSSFLRAVEEEPILSSFENLSEKSKDEKRATIESIREIAERYKKEQGIRDCEDDQLKKDLGMLYKYSVEALRYSE